LHEDFPVFYAIGLGSNDLLNFGREVIDGQRLVLWGLRTESRPKVSIKDFLVVVLTLGAIFSASAYLPPTLLRRGKELWSYQLLVLKLNVPWGSRKPAEVLKSLLPTAGAPRECNFVWKGAEGIYSMGRWLVE